MEAIVFVNHSVTVIIYVTDIPLTLLTMDAISVAALAIPMSRHAPRAILQAKVQLLAPTCVRRQQQQHQQRQQRHLQQRRLRQQRH